MRVFNNMAMSIGAMDVIVRPTITNPSASDILMMRNAVGAINRSARKAGNMTSLAQVFIDGYMRSHTGAFCIPTRDSNGYVESFEFIDPLAPHPHYGEYGGILTLAPTLDNPYAEGIWYVLPGELYPFRHEDYFQEAYGAYGSGKWLVGSPLTHRVIGDVLMDVVLADIERRSASGTDPSQIISIANVAPEKIKEWKDNADDYKARKARGERPAYSESNPRLVLYKESSDSLADDPRVNVYDLRLFPKDFNLLEAQAKAAHNIARGLGVSVKWVADEKAQGYSGNAVQLALSVSDSPGMDSVVVSFTSMLQEMLLPGVPATITLQSKSAPETYAQVNSDKVAAEVAKALVETGLPQSVAQLYLMKRGAIGAADIGTYSLSLQSDGDMITDAGIPQAIAFQRDVARLVNPIRPELPFVSPKRPTQMEKAAGDEGYMQCMALALSAFDDWANTQVPTMISGGSIDPVEARRDIDEITQTVGGMLSLCGLKMAGAQRGQRVNQYLDTLKFGLFNRWGSPALNKRSTPMPKDNMYSKVLSLRNMLSGGDITPDDVAGAVNSFRFDIQRYFASVEAVKFIVAGSASSGPVEWVLNDMAHHCSECPKFSGRYGSFSEMLVKTSGKYPRDIRLMCSGNCKCNLVIL